MRKYLLLLLLPALLLSCKSQAERELTGRFETMKKSAEFGTVEYTVKKLIKANDVGKWYAIGDRKILFSCTAYLKAGIDLEEFTMEDIEINGNSVHVTFPHAKLLSLNMPPEEIKLIYDRVAFFRSGFSAADRLDLQVQAEQDINEDIVNMGITAEAETNAKDLFTAMLRQIGFKNITIDFE